MPNNFDLKRVKERCKTYRHEILDISQRVGALHIAPAFSCLEITDVIYHHLLRVNEQHTFLDHFIMSKGHGCMSQYVILKELGYLTEADLLSYCQPHGRLGAHPDYGLPGITASTGSLGHGLGIATGLALANRLQNKPNHTYVILSDGELQEGSTWEALMMAANLALTNLTIFIDLNDFSGLARMSTDHPAFYPVKDKLIAFGWATEEVDGHDSQAIYDRGQQRHPTKPNCVICHTVKGKGVSYMEHIPIWHYRSPNKEEYWQAKKELETVLLAE